MQNVDERKICLRKSDTIVEAVDCKTASSWEFGLGQDGTGSDKIHISPSGSDDLCLGKVDGDDNGFMVDCMNGEG